MENEIMVVLPHEIEQLAQGVSAEKRTEVQTVLNQIFNGVSKMRKQLDAVKVENENDKVNMKLANTIRLGVRDIRLDAEKTFDAKRSEVQLAMLSYKTEDSLWLKAKQTMQILTKEIEELARYKEETKERFDKERKELKIRERMEKVLIYSTEIQVSEIENMSDETFDIFLKSLEKSYNDKIGDEKKAEAERIEKEKAIKLHNERKEQILPYWGFIPLEKRSEDFSTFTENEWKERFDWCVTEKKKDDDIKEAQRKENERLKAEAELKQLRDKERHKQLQPYIIFIRDYNKMLNMPDSEYQKEFSDIKIGAEQHWEYERKEQIRQQAENEAKEQQLKAARFAAEKAAAEKAKLQAEIMAKELAAEKARKEAELKAIAEQKAKKAEAKKAASAPDKEKLLNFAKMIDSLVCPEIKDEELKKVLSDTTVLLMKTSSFLRSKLQ